MGTTDKHSLHGLFNTSNCVYGVSSLSACTFGEHELLKSHFWGGNDLEHRLVVRLWKEDLLGTGEGGH